MIGKIIVDVIVYLGLGIIVLGELFCIAVAIAMIVRKNRQRVE